MPEDLTPAITQEEQARQLKAARDAEVLELDDQEPELAPNSEVWSGVDTDGMPLTGPEVKRLVIKDLEDLVKDVTAILAKDHNFNPAYAYPRVLWKVSLTVVPCYSDEKPMHHEISGGSPPGVGVAGNFIVADKVQKPVLNPDRLRPEKKQSQIPTEETSQGPVKLNKMVREIK